MKHKVFRSFFVLILIIGLMAMQVPRSAQAAGPWYVATTGSDGNDCLSPSTPCATINGAIGKAIAGDTIYVVTGTYTGTSGYSAVIINKSITLSGGWDANFATQSGTSSIDGQNIRRGIAVLGVGVVASLDHFLIKNGEVVDAGVSIQGGGIYNAANLTVTNSTIQNNKSSALLEGGGIYNQFGTMTLINTTISNNTSPYHGGGIANFYGTMTLTNTTISNNTSGYAGGISNAYGTMTMNNVTISNNTSQVSGGIWVIGGDVSIMNSILAGNTATILGPDCKVNNTGLLISEGNNILGNTSDCSFSPGSGDLTNIDPLLGPLQDNGGSTFTQSLLAGSPAIDTGNDATCEATDQRGVARPQGAACDIGAFELEAGIDVSIDIKPGSDTNPINMKSKGKIPVAILSTVDFDALAMVNVSSLTFGKTGDEESLAFCNENGEDVNVDGLLDLVCHFETQLAGFLGGDLEGVLKGETVDGTPLEGRDVVTILD